MEYAHQEYIRWMVIESLGVFWLAAEVLILALIRAGRDYLMNLHATVEWKPPLLRILITGIASLLILLAVTYGRHWFLPPVHTMLAQSTQDIASIKSLFRQRYHEHMIIWSAFVTGWVLLEVFIVYHGWRGYLSLRRFMQDGAPA